MGSEVEDIKQRLDIVDIIQEYLQLKKAGSNYKGVCPFHQEKTPSFMVSQSKQIWHCFGCHEGGDIFSFIQRMEGIDFFESLKLLGDKAGVKIKKKKAESSDKKQRLLEVLDLSSQFFYKILLDHPKAEDARTYLTSRELSADTIKKFQLGYAPDSWEVLLKFLQQRGFSQQEIIDAGMAVYNQERNSVYDRFRNRVMIPLRDVYGNIVGFTARALGEDYQGGKYINTPQTLVYDKSRIAYGLYFAKKAIKETDYVVIVEGNMDVIASHQAGVLPVVGVSGTALTEQQIGLIKRFTTTCIFAFDADSAGVMAARRGVELVMEAGLDVKVLSLPAGKDPDDCIREDVHLWMHAIADAEHVVDYLINAGIRQHDATTARGKKIISEDVIPILAYIQNPVERDHYVQLLANELRTSAQSIHELLAQVKKHKKTTEIKISTPPAKKPEKRSVKDETCRGLLAILVKFPELLAEIGPDVEYFANMGLGALYKNLKKSYDESDRDKGGGFDISEFSDSLSSDLQTLLTHLLLYADKEFHDFSPQQSRDAFKARIQFLQRHYLKQELQRVQQAIIKAENRADTAVFEELSVEFSQISGQLAELE